MLAKSSMLAANYAHDEVMNTLKECLETDYTLIDGILVLWHILMFTLEKLPDGSPHLQDLGQYHLPHFPHSLFVLRVLIKA